MSAAPAPAQFPGGVKFVEASVDKDKLTWTETTYVPVTKTVEVQVVVGGMTRTEKQTVTEMLPQQVTRSVELKNLKVADGAGKAIAADKVADALKESPTAVMTVGPLPERHRKLFKEKTVFVEIPAPKFPGPPPLPPGVVPPPPPTPDPPGKKNG